MSVHPWPSSMSPAKATATRCCPPHPQPKKVAECYDGSQSCVTHKTVMYLEKSSYKHPFPFILKPQSHKATLLAAISSGEYLPHDSCCY